MFKNKILFFILFLMIFVYKLYLQNYFQFDNFIKDNVDISKNKLNSIKERKLFKVIKVIDGDTIVLENNEKVRYIGIDTPELFNKRSRTIDCFAKEAKEINKELLEGKYVYLEKDISDRDKYGRLLRYVWVADLFVNAYLVKEGYAYAVTYPPDIKYSDLFHRLEQDAKKNNKGLWSKCNNSQE